jgi:hypothetical protein
MTTLNKPLADAVREAVSAIAASIENLPDKIVGSDFGLHDVWYAIDEQGPHACVEASDLFGLQTISEFDDRDTYPFLGFRVDITDADVTVLEAAGVEVLDRR